MKIDQKDCTHFVKNISWLSYSLESMEMQKPVSLYFDEGNSEWNKFFLLIISWLLALTVKYLPTF